MGVKFFDHNKHQMYDFMHSIMTQLYLDTANDEGG